MLQTLSKEQNDLLWELGKKYGSTKDRIPYLNALFEKCRQIGIGILFYDDAAFPAMLRQIKDPPRVLFYRGDLSLLQKDAFAIVGTRLATGYGLKAAYEIAKVSAESGFVIVSGMAKGIDASAHKGALDGGGETIALMPCGLDKCYPPTNAWLYDRVLIKGLALSEYPPGTHTEKWYFLERNRLISGLCLATVVVQAPERSGAVNTAQHAADQGRDVYAVPGSIFERQSVGVHRLIADGCELIQTPDTLVKRYQQKQITYMDSIKPRSGKTLDQWGWLYERIDSFGSLSEDLVKNSDEDPALIQMGLTMLQMEGLIDQNGEGKWLKNW